MLNVSGVVKNYDFIKYKNTYAIIMEDFGGVSLDKVIKEKKINLKSFLIIAVKLCKILDEIHNKNIIYKDVKPHNVVINTKTSEIKFIDFSISTKLPKETQGVVNPNGLEGTIHYISPEQTGRMNRSIDYRTDYYSLGITFYEMLTGVVPFDSEDPMEIIHSHIAKIPESINSLNSDVPNVVSNIIMKLLEKNAEDRYQSTFGLVKDLEKCYAQLKENNVIEDFEIGKTDISKKFQIPEKLYGREKEVELLLKSFDDVSYGSKEILFFLGGAGIGKTSIINEVHKPIVEKRGFFIQGKFDQFKKNIPYTAIIQAFQEFVRQVITESSSEIARWKDIILEAVGANGQVIISIIPELEFIIGKQPDIQSLPPPESQNRFNMVFQNFVKAIAGKDNPLVVFIDDLQWADSASLVLINTLLNDEELSYLLFIGAYRENEVDETHIFTKELKNNLIKNEIEFSDIEVVPLSIESISNLIHDTLKSDDDVSDKLAGIIYDKTRGNPFFVCELLKSLHQKELITFDDGWKVDVSGAASAGISDNVVELMAEKIKSIESNALELLKTASCIGVKFYIDTLCEVSGKSEKETFDVLLPAFSEGFIIKIDDGCFKFAHDRVREATYSLISEDDVNKLHYMIGKVLITKPEDQSHENRVFSIVNQWNLCHELLNNDEKKELVNLNYLSGKKAKENSAYDAAVNFFRKGSGLLKDEQWNTDYEMITSYYIEWLEAEYLTGDFDSGERLSQVVIDNGNSSYDKARVYDIKSTFYSNLGKVFDAVKYGSEALSQLGVDIKLDASLPPEEMMGIIQELMKSFYQTMGDIKISDLIDFPSTDKKETILIQKILGALLYPTFCINGLVFTINALALANSSIKDGYTPYSDYGISVMGLLSIIFSGDYKSAKEFANSAMKISDRFNNLSSKSRMINVVGTFITTWTDSLETSIQYNYEGYRYGIESGDYPHAGMNIHNIIVKKLWGGVNISELLNEIEETLKFASKTNTGVISLFILPTKQVLLNLTGKLSNTFSLDDDSFNTEDFNNLNSSLQNFSGLFSLLIVKGIMHYVYGDYDSAYEVFESSKQYLFATGGWQPMAPYYLYSSLSSLSVYNEADTDRQKELLTFVDENLKIIQGLSDINPSTFEHMYYLIDAERNRISGNTTKAMEFYDMAIESAKANGFTNNEAIANELASKFYMSLERNKIAAMYMVEAKYCYEKWGAVSKVKQIKDKYSFLLESIAMGNASQADSVKSASIVGRATRKTSKTTESSNFLDIATILKATQTISSEIEMGKLLSKLVKILIENAGAEKGALILKKGDDNFTVEAEAVSSSDDIKVLHSVPVDESKTLSAAVIRYVIKTKENIILDDASNTGTYTRDRYISDNKVKSVLCIPIVNQGNLVAVLYLENNVATGAFTPARVETLNVLSSQAAISIENARLIDEMKDKARLQQEMAIAERIQTSLCPAAPEHNELEITAVMRPAEEVGGDYYDVVTDKDKNTWFAIGDVSGHGVTPGLVMMMAETGFNVVVEGKSTLTPAEAIVEVNRILNKNVRQRLKESHFMTMSFLKYTGNGKFAYAGSHLDIVVWRAAAKKCELFKTEGIFLSIIPDITPMTQNFDITLNSGDIMVLYTDGVIESRFKGDRTKLWGMEGLCEAVENSASGGVEAVKDAVVKGALDWCDQKPDDDITMIVIKKK